MIWSICEWKKYIQSNTIQQPKVIYNKLNFVLIFLKVRIIKGLHFWKGNVFAQCASTWLGMHSVQESFKKLPPKIFLILHLSHIIKGFSVSSFKLYHILWFYYSYFLLLPLRLKRKRKNWELLRWIKTKLKTPEKWIGFGKGQLTLQIANYPTDLRNIANAMSH